MNTTRALFFVAFSLLALAFGHSWHGTRSKPTAPLEHQIGEYLVFNHTVTAEDVHKLYKAGLAPYPACNEDALRKPGSELTAAIGHRMSGHFNVIILTKDGPCEYRPAPQAYAEASRPDAGPAWDAQGATEFAPSGQSNIIWAAGNGTSWNRPLVHSESPGPNEPISKEAYQRFLDATRTPLPTWP